MVVSDRGTTRDQATRLFISGALVPLELAAREVRLLPECLPLDIDR